MLSAHRSYRTKRTGTFTSNQVVDILRIWTHGHQFPFSYLRGSTTIVRFNRKSVVTIGSCIIHFIAFLFFSRCKKLVCLRIQFCPRSIIIRTIECPIFRVHFGSIGSRGQRIGSDSLTTISIPSDVETTMISNILRVSIIVYQTSDFRTDRSISILRYNCTTGGHIRVTRTKYIRNRSIFVRTFSSIISFIIVGRTSCQTKGN